jgi:predicted enzyme related to lactoylglutathione lyase
MPRVVHFEISADDPARATTFYTQVFGWQFKKWDGPEPYWLVETGPNDQPGINGGMFVRKGQVGHVNTIDVSSIDDFIEKINAAGGECVVPKMPIPGVGWLAYCKDTEGSIFGLHQNDPGAK